MARLPKRPLTEGTLIDLTSSPPLRKPKIAKITHAADSSSTASSSISSDDSGFQAYRPLSPQAKRALAIPKPVLAKVEPKPASLPKPLKPATTEPVVLDKDVFDYSKIEADIRALKALYEQAEIFGIEWNQDVIDDAKQDKLYTEAANGTSAVSHHPSSSSTSSSSISSSNLKRPFAAISLNAPRAAPSDEGPSKPFEATRLGKLPSAVLNRLLSMDLELSDHLALAGTCKALRGAYDNATFYSLLAKLHPKEMRASLERLRDLTDKDTLAHLRTAWTRIGIRTGDAKAGGDGVRSSLDNLLQGKQYRDYAAKFVNSDLLQPDEARKTFRLTSAQMKPLNQKWNWETYTRTGFSRPQVRRFVFKQFGGPLGYRDYYNKTEADTMSSRALKAWDTKRAKQAKATALMQMKACAASETLDISSLDNIGRHLGLPYVSVIVDTMCPQEQAEAYKGLAAKSHDDLERQNEFVVLGNVSLSLRELELQQEIRTLRGKATVESSSYRQRGLLGLPVSVLDLLLTMNFDLADHIALSQTCRRLRSVYTHEIWAALCTVKPRASKSDSKAIVARRKLLPKMFTDSANYMSFNHVADCGFNTVRPGHRCCRHVCEVFGSDWSWDYKASIIKHIQSIWVDEVGAEVEWGLTLSQQKSLSKRRILPSLSMFEFPQVDIRRLAYATYGIHAIERAARLKDKPDGLLGALNKIGKKTLIVAGETERPKKKLKT